MKIFMADKRKYSPDLSLQDELIRDRSREIVILWILVLWFCCILYFNPRLLALTYAAPNVLSKLAVIVFTLCLDSIWLYTIYHGVMVGMSWFLNRRTAEPVLPELTETPPVAILYPTRNDFRSEAVESCLNVDYPSARLFILDDSTLPEFHERIDRWAEHKKGRVTVIRRQHKHGYKAGNLNHALQRIEKDFPYFAISDADGKLPENFIRGLLPYFYADSRIGFVQALQEVNPDQSGFLPRAMGFMIEAHYRYYVRARQRYGFVMFYGHGALLKTSIWKMAGGFPEITTEDLAYAARIRELGYQGIYTERVVCREDFPPGLTQLRLRSEKWIRGTSEFLKVGYGRFVRSGKIPWFEKVDVLINAFSHYQSAVMLIFLLTLGTLLPVYFDHFRYPGSFFLMPVPYGKSIVEYLVHIRYHIFWSFDFYAMMMGSIVFPLLPAIFNLRRKPRPMIRYMVFSTFSFLSSLVVETLAVVSFWITGKAVFRNTLDAALTQKTGLLYLLEIMSGIGMFAIGMKTRNLWFMAPAAALLLGPFVCQLSWEARWLRALSCVPFILTLVIIIFVTLDLLLMQKLF